MILSREKKFQRYFKGISKKLRKFHECFKAFQGILKQIKSLSKKVCLVVVVVAASRAEGGLVKFT